MTAALVLNAIRTKYPVLSIEAPAGLLDDLAAVADRLDAAALRHDPNDLAVAVADALEAARIRRPTRRY